MKTTVCYCINEGQLTQIFFFIIRSKYYNYYFLGNLLHWAVDGDNVDLAKNLIQNYNIDINCKDNQGHTAYLLICFILIILLIKIFI